MGLHGLVIGLAHLIGHTATAHGAAVVANPGHALGAATAKSAAHHTTAGLLKASTKKTVGNALHQAGSNVANTALQQPSGLSALQTVGEAGMSAGGVYGAMNSLDEIVEKRRNRQLMLTAGDEGEGDNPSVPLRGRRRQTRGKKPQPSKQVTNRRNRYLPQPSFSEQAPVPTPLPALLPDPLCLETPRREVTNRRNRYLPEPPTLPVLSPPPLPVPSYDPLCLESPQNREVTTPTYPHRNRNRNRLQTSRQNTSTNPHRSSIPQASAPSRRILAVDTGRLWVDQDLDVYHEVDVYVISDDEGDFDGGYYDDNDW